MHNQAFAVFDPSGNSELRNPFNLCLEFQTALPPIHNFRIPVQETPTLPQNLKMPPMVWKLDTCYFLESPNVTETIFV